MPALARAARDAVDVAESLADWRGGRRPDCALMHRTHSSRTTRAHASSARVCNPSAPTQLARVRICED
eukprot:6208479-Pleurochrysis_carterae.AAC.3